MKIKELLREVKYTCIQGNDSIEIDNICWDSRRVTPNSLFICVKGKNVDRHNFIHRAVDEGAVAFLVENNVLDIPKDIVLLKVDNSREAMAIIANKFYDEPSKKLNLIGITGTNGKTSVSYFIAKILEASNRRVGIIGTIENKIGHKVIDVEKLNPTTPDAIELQRTLNEMAIMGAADVAMEVTSIALTQNRVDCCNFNIGIFTNLTQDHLDEHGTIENYKNAKMKLFRMCKKGIINADDPIYCEICEQATCDILTYGINNDSDFRAKNILYLPNAVTFTLDFRGVEKEIRLNIPGRFSVYNVLAAIGACYSSGLTLDEIAEGVSLIENVKGRAETVPDTDGRIVIVDYAHTPNGLENILTSVKCLNHYNLNVVFGCGGDRDRTKRPIMGEIAGRIADFCIITSDNPRTEDPGRIIEDICAGLKRTGCIYQKVADRKEAIYTALDNSQEGDIIVIAGKGHEAYQIINGKVISFDDVEIVKEYYRKNKNK